MSILPSPAVRAMFPSKIAALDELGAYAEGRTVTPAGAALACPPLGFVLSTVAHAADAAAGGGGGGGGGGAGSAVKRAGVGAVIAGGRKGAPTTARGFSGMAPAASGATVVKSTLKKAEEDDGGARVQIDHVVVMGTGPDDACNAFEANPFKPECALAWKWGGGGGATTSSLRPAAALCTLCRPALSHTHGHTHSLYPPTTTPCSVQAM
jgi:hypothetical protein